MSKRKRRWRRSSRPAKRNTAPPSQILLEALEPRLLLSTGPGQTWLLPSHFGGAWSDVDKAVLDFDDDNLCWAAAASNVLDWSGWGAYAGFDNAGEIFEYFEAHWTDEGSLSMFGWDWFFDGTATVPGPDWADVNVPGGGFFPNVDVNYYLKDEGVSDDAVSVIADYLRDGYGVALGIKSEGWLLVSDHAVTCWGFNYNPSDPNEIYGIWITDSDDDLPPLIDYNLRYCPVVLGGDNRWHLKDYGELIGIPLGDFYITEVEGLRSPYRHTLRHPVIEGNSWGDDFRVVREGEALNVYLNGATSVPSHSFLFEAIRHLTINGNGGDDTLLLDLSGGDVVPGLGYGNGITFNGGDHSWYGDDLVVRHGSLSSVSYSANGVGTGELHLNGDPTPITFTGLEPLTIVPSSLGQMRVAVADGESHTVELVDDGAGGNNRSRVRLDGGLESVTFVNPTDRLVINAVGAASTISVLGYDAHFSPASMGLYAGSGSTINVLRTPAGSVTDIDMGLSGPNQLFVGVVAGQEGTGAGSIANIAGDIQLATHVEQFTDLLTIDNSGNGADCTWTIDLPSAGLGRIAASSAAGAITYAPDHTGRIRVFAGSGDDDLTVDCSAGMPIPAAGLDYDGGPGADQLTIAGGAFGDVVYNASGPGTGELDLDGRAVTFTDLEPVTVTSGIGSLTIDITDGLGHEIVIEDAPGANNARVTLDGGLESITFTHPSATLTVNAGDEGDNIRVKELEPTLAADVVVNAGAGKDFIRVQPSTSAPISINGGAPVFGDPGVPPGDVLVLSLDGVAGAVIQRSLDSGSMTSASHQTVVWTSIEMLIAPDEFEYNDVQAAATVLGSQPEVTLRNLSIHDEEDVDFFRITAHDTGKLIVNALFLGAVGDIDVQIVDAAGNVIASSTSTVDREQIVIPVVSQEQYFLRVFGLDGDVNNYELEIENFAAPVPDSVVLDPADDTGLSNSDNVTSEDESRVLIEADLADFAASGIDILTPTEVADQEPGAAVEVFVNGASVGYATPVPGTNFDLFVFTFAPGDLSTSFLPVVGGGGLNEVKAAVRIFDGQRDGDGQPQPASDRTDLSEPLLLTLDATPPVAPTVQLLASSDSPPPGDGITTNGRPAFQGTAEPNTVVRLFANGEYVGTAVASSAGEWEITSAPLRDDNYIFTAESEDLAGNVSARSADLPLTIAIDYGFEVDPITGAVIYHGEDNIRDVMTLSLNGAGTNLVVDWQQPTLGRFGSSSFVLADTPSIRIVTHGGDDTLIVDNSNGLVALTDGILYDGGEGTDVLQLVGSTAVDAVTYNVGAEVGSGSVVHTGAGQVQAVRFERLAPVLDTVSGPLVVNGTPASNVINYHTAYVPGSVPNGYENGEPTGPRSDLQPTGHVSIDNFEVLEFANKSALTIFGHAGHDTIDLNNAAAIPGLAQITLDGGSGDDTLTGSAAADRLLGGRGDDLLRGGDGDDELLGGEGDDVLEGNAGDDFLDGGNGSDNLDGGSGMDSALFRATDEPDTMEMTAASVTVNGAVNTIANIEVVTLETYAGDDAVTVRAGEGFPLQLAVNTGDGDDDVWVHLANPAPATVIEIDGGPHLYGDSATIKGATGDDQFEVYDDGMVVVFGAAQVNLFDVEEVAVLEGRRIDADRATVEQNKFKFTDADGNTTTARISGLGAADVFRNIVNGRNADIYSLELIDTTDAKTSLAVNVKKARETDNETSIREITGSGAKSINARKSDLIGRGVELAGGLRNLKLDDIRSGADIVTGGDSGRKLNLSADQVGFVDLVTGEILNNLRVSTWAGGTLQASVMNNVIVTNGPFGADLVNTRQNRGGYGLKNLSVKGGDLISNITADRIKSVKVAGGDARVTATVTSDAITLAGKTAFESLSVTGGDLLGAAVNLKPDTLLKKIAVKAARGLGGNVRGAVVVTGDLGNTSVSGDLEITRWEVAGEMGDLTVKGTATSLASSPMAVRSGGSMGALTLGSARHVDFQAGIVDGVRLAEDPVDFIAPATIESIKIKGYKVPKGTPAPRFVVDSYFSSASLGKARLLNVDFDTSSVNVLDQGGEEIVQIRHKDTVDETLNFVYPPKPGEVFAGPADFINIL